VTRLCCTAGGPGAHGAVAIVSSRRIAHVRTPAAGPAGQPHHQGSRRPGRPTGGKGHEVHPDKADENLAEQGDHGNMMQNIRHPAGRQGS